MTTTVPRVTAARVAELEALAFEAKAAGDWEALASVCDETRRLLGARAADRAADLRGYAALYRSQAARMYAEADALEASANYHPDRQGVTALGLQLKAEELGRLARAYELRADMIVEVA